MDTLFFFIQIIGLAVIAFWAHRNDRCDRVSLQDGLLAMIVPEGAGVEESAEPADVEMAPKHRRPPPRRRFVAS